MYTVGLPNAACASPRVSADRRQQRRLGMHDAHAAPAAAAGRLDDDRVADGRAPSRTISFGSSGNAPSEPGTHGTPAFSHRLPWR